MWVCVFVSVCLSNVTFHFAALHLFSVFYPFSVILANSLFFVLSAFLSAFVTLGMAGTVWPLSGGKTLRKREPDSQAIAKLAAVEPETRFKATTQRLSISL